MNEPLEPVRLLGFSGSLRRGSCNTALLRAAGEVLPAGASLDIFDLAPIPLYNFDVESAGLPEAVQAFKSAIEMADALVIVTPEYNFSVPGVLKNAIDWASRPPKHNSFDGKPAVLMGASPGVWGTTRCQYQLRQVCQALNLHLLNRPEVFVSKVAEKFDGEGRLTDEATRRTLRSALEALVAWTLRLRQQG